MGGARGVPIKLINNVNDMQRVGIPPRYLLVFNVQSSK